MFYVTINTTRSVRRTDFKKVTNDAENVWSTLTQRINPSHKMNVHFYVAIVFCEAKCNMFVVVYPNISKFPRFSF